MRMGFERQIDHTDNISDGKERKNKANLDRVKAGALAGLVAFGGMEVAVAKPPETLGRADWFEGMEIMERGAKHERVEWTAMAIIRPDGTSRWVVPHVKHEDGTSTIVENLDAQLVIETHEDVSRVCYVHTHPLRGLSEVGSVLPPGFDPKEAIIKHKAPSSPFSVGDIFLMDFAEGFADNIPTRKNDESQKIGVSVGAMDAIGLWVMESARDNPDRAANYLGISVEEARTTLERFNNLKADIEQGKMTLGDLSYSDFQRGWGAFAKAQSTEQNKQAEEWMRGFVAKRGYDIDRFTDQERALPRKLYLQYNIHIVEADALNAFIEELFQDEDVKQTFQRYRDAESEMSLSYAGLREEILQFIISSGTEQTISEKKIKELATHYFKVGGVLINHYPAEELDSMPPCPPVDYYVSYEQ